MSRNSNWNSGSIVFAFDWTNLQKQRASEQLPNSRVAIVGHCELVPPIKDD